MQYTSEGTLLLKNDLGWCLQRALYYRYSQWRAVPAENRASHYLKFLAASLIFTVLWCFLCSFLFLSNILVPPGFLQPFHLPNILVESSLDPKEAAKKWSSEQRCNILIWSSVLLLIYWIETCWKLILVSQRCKPQSLRKPTDRCWKISDSCQADEGWVQLSSCLDCRAGRSSYEVALEQAVVLSFCPWE